MKPQLETGSFVEASGVSAHPDEIRLVSWNINRGGRLNETISFLAAMRADLILLQETDLNARRTDCRNVARDIAQALQMAYVFAWEFEELTEGCNAGSAYHGQATLSRVPLVRSRVLRFDRQSSFWRPRWFIPRTRLFQRRLGGRIALINDVELPERKLVLYNVHLESRGSDGLRCDQLSEICADMGQYGSDVAVVVAGDFNFNLRNECASSFVSRSGLSNPFDPPWSRPTTVGSLLHRPRAIDWILTRGSLVVSEPKVHDSIHASDHYPLSLTLRCMPVWMS
ncbi:MAG: endonuclease/exonuclease/phosphatase family protein [Terracidiphilus sp.]